MKKIVSSTWFFFFSLFFAISSFLLFIYVRGKVVEESFLLHNDLRLYMELESKVGRLKKEWEGEIHPLTLRKKARLLRMVPISPEKVISP